MPGTMVISPHLDDEVYSSASFLKADDPNLVVVYCNDTHPVTPTEVIQAENRALMDFLRCRRIVFPSPGTNYLDTIVHWEMIKFFEETIHTCRPDTIVLPFPSYNQDHRVVYEAALTALRPHDTIPLVKRVLLYEEPETFGALRTQQHQPFRPTYFRPIDMDYKRRLIEFYTSQLRGHRHLSHVEAIARVRGSVSGHVTAEAFEVLRWVE